MSPAKRTDKTEVATIRMSKEAKEKLHKAAKAGFRTFADQCRMVLEEWSKSQK